MQWCNYGSVNFIFRYSRFAWSSFSTSKLPISLIRFIWKKTTIAQQSFQSLWFHLWKWIDYDASYNRFSLLLLLLQSLLVLLCSQKCKFAKIKFVKFNFCALRSNTLSPSTWPYRFILACYNSVYYVP